MPSLSVRDDMCAILTSDAIGRGAGNCQQPPTMRALWRFDTPGPLRILLCAEHGAELAGDERMTLIGRSAEKPSAACRAP